jgi:predicted acyltransferase
MGEAFAFSLSAAVNPTLFTALMVMLVSRNAERLMLGYLLGAYVISITLGLVIVFALPTHSAPPARRGTRSVPQWTWRSA